MHDVPVRRQALWQQSDRRYLCLTLDSLFTYVLLSYCLSSDYSIISVRECQHVIPREVVTNGTINLPHIYRKQPNQETLASCWQTIMDHPETYLMLEVL